MGSGHGPDCGLSLCSDRNPPPQQLRFLTNFLNEISDGDLHYSKTISTMIPNASAELPALKEAQPPPPRSKGDQLTFLQRLLILLATICTMIVIDHGCVSSSPEGHAGFVSEYAFSTSSCTLLMKCLSDQTTVQAPAPLLCAGVCPWCVGVCLYCAGVFVMLKWLILLKW